jgi:hypothetical protein
MDLQRKEIAMDRRGFLKTPALTLLLPSGLALDESGALGGFLGGEDTPENAPGKFPQKLHQDFTTYVQGIEYFVLGNGDIIAVLQYCPDRSGDRPPTFLGLTIMDAEHFARKWSTFLFHPEAGFSRSTATIAVNTTRFTPTPETYSSVEWKYIDRVPVISLKWKAGQCEVEEEFYVPHELRLLFRRITVVNGGSTPCDVTAHLSLVPSFIMFDDIHSNPPKGTVDAAGFAQMRLHSLEGEVRVSGRYDMAVPIGSLPAGSSGRARFVYALNGDESVLTRKSDAELWSETVEYWRSKEPVASGNRILDHLYNVSRTELKALVARSGKRDSGFWMYNMEWVRDDVMVTLGMLYAGFYEEARTLLVKILEKSVGEDGRTIESSRWYGYDYTELDQNGQLLYGLWSYLCWTGDEALIRKYWDKIKATGFFPLQDVFWDKKTRMLRNKREFWERDDRFGVEDGYELAYQFWVALGLEKGAEVATALGDQATAKAWADAAKEIRHGMLEDPASRLIENGSLIKRRTREGRHQRYMIPMNRQSMPPGSPLALNEKPECDPDTASVYPIIYEMVDPQGPLAKKTLASMEKIWNQFWKHGGYGRYNTTSEPDPPGPWPFASLFVARACVEAGDSEGAWRVLNWLYNIFGGRSGGWFERYGPSITPPAPPVCITGWTFAEITSLVVRHIMGVRPEIQSLVLRPRLISGIDGMKGRFRIHGADLIVSIARTTEKPYALLDGRRTPLEKGRLVVPYEKLKPLAAIEVYV